MLHDELDQFGLRQLRRRLDAAFGQVRLDIVGRGQQVREVARVGFDGKAFLELPAALQQQRMQRRAEPQGLGG